MVIIVDPVGVRMPSSEAASSHSSWEVIIWSHSKVSLSAYVWGGAGGGEGGGGEGGGAGGIDGGVGGDGGSGGPMQTHIYSRLQAVGEAV
jgi:hypothetical protein